MNDTEAIKRLKARYFRALDTKDWAAFRALFTDDFVSDTTASGGDVIKGADAFVSFVSQTLATNTTVHHGHMPEIELTGEDTASGIWAMEDLVRFLGCIDMRGYGHYHETYRRENGEWRISYSKLTRLRMDVLLLIIPIKIPRFLMNKMDKSSSAATG